MGSRIKNAVQCLNNRVSPGCPQPSIALQCRIVAKNTIHFIFVHNDQLQHTAFV